jgi:hypothetical protein
MIGTLMFDRTITVAPLESLARSFPGAGVVSIVSGLLIILAVGIGLAWHRGSSPSSREPGLGGSFGVNREAA